MDDALFPDQVFAYIGMFTQRFINHTFLMHALLCTMLCLKKCTICEIAIKLLSLSCLTATTSLHFYFIHLKPCSVHEQLHGTMEKGTRFGEHPSWIRILVRSLTN